MCLEQGALWGAVIAGSISAGTLLFWLHRRLCRYLLLKNPLAITYLIPRSKYKAKVFPGAPEQEGRPSNLTIGLGKTIVMHEIIPKTDLIVDDIVMSFTGDETPINKCSNNPYIIERIQQPHNRFHFTDWDGEIHSVPNDGTVRFRKKQPWKIGNLIEATKPYNGYMTITFMFRNAPTRIKILRFQVTDVETLNQTPFMKKKD